MVSGCWYLVSGSVLSLPESHPEPTAVGLPEAAQQLSEGSDEKVLRSTQLSEEEGGGGAHHQCAVGEQGGRPAYVRGGGEY